MIHDGEFTSVNQFGFRPKRSTEDAIVRLRELVQDSEDFKYVLALPLDISGAFDNLWWPGLLENLKERGCQSNVYKVVQSYLTKREVCCKTAFCEVRKNVSKGCPQGSIFGPPGWNLVFDGLLKILEQSNYEALAYADDIIIVIRGNSRNELSNAGQRMMDITKSWLTEQKLSLSVAKCGMILLKGTLDHETPPVVRLDGKKLKLLREIDYLGVRITERLRFSSHVENLTVKSQKAFKEMANVARSTWGLEYGSLNVLYKSLFLPRVTYAAAGWWDRTNVRDKRKLAQLQRRALLRTIKAYNTVSHEAAHVIAAVLPIDLEMDKKVAYYNIRQRRDFNIRGIQIKGDDIVTGRVHSLEAKHLVEDALTDEWQRRWDASTKGRITYEFFNSVKERLNKDWLKPDHFTTQFLSGHGSFKSYLHTRGLTEDPSCECGAEQSAKHILFECTEVDEIRKPLMETITKAGHAWPCELSVLVSDKNIFRELGAFARGYLNKESPDQL